MSLIVLAHPNLPPEALRADIVAIPSLFPVAAGTTESTQFSWLRERFKYESLRSRVLLYHYDTQKLLAPGAASDLVLCSQATVLINTLVAERQMSRADERPLIFLCHGFGGLLLQRALALTRESNRPPERFQSLRSSTYAVIFAGTPHRGINQDALGVLYRDSSKPPNQFVLDLIRNSDLIEEIASEFQPLLKEIRIVNFWEQVPSVNGKASAIIVEEQSAAPLDYTLERCGIMSDHESLLNFSSFDDGGFHLVNSALESCLKDSARELQQKATKTYEQTALTRQGSQGRPQGHNMWQNEITGRAVHVGDVYVYNTIDSTALVRQQDTALVPSLLDMYGKLPRSGCEMYKVERASSPQFTGRRVQADILLNGLSLNTAETREKHRIAVIYGLGGSGKTQFCLRFAEQHRSSYWGVFWIDVSTRANAEAGYASLGLEAGKGATFSAGKFWLSQCKESWLLILDNADDLDMDMSDFIPTGSQGHVLISTRNPNIIVHANAGALRFRGMDPEDGIELLLKSAFPLDEPDRREPQKRTLARSIAAELGYLAIALDQAGATIRRKIYTLERYLHLYLGHRHRLLKSQSKIFAPEANVITTWEIPFKQIERRSTTDYKDAVTLLHLFAFLHFETICEDIFYACWISMDEPMAELPPLLRLDSRQTEEAQERLRQAIGVLCDHSIVDHDTRRRACTLHPVVHRWARTRLAETEQDAYWLDCTAQLLMRCISPHLEASGRTFRRSLLPHIDSCVELLRSNNAVFPGNKKRARQLERFALVYADNGRWNQAIRLQKEVVDFRVRVLGKAEEDTLRIQRALSNSLWNLFQVKQVIDIQHALLIRRWWYRPRLADWLSFLKPDHITYCIALDDLTQSLWLAGQRQLSQRAGERAVAGFLKRLGPDDPLTLNAMFNLGRTYHHLGETSKSHTLLATVLRKRRLFFGADHPQTLMARNELGMSLCARKSHLGAAEKLVRSVIEARKRILGEEHAYTLWSVNDLSKILCERGRPEEAASMLEDIVPVVERTLGHDHVGMNMTKGNLARAYVKARRWTEAERLLREMLDLLRDDHPDWVETMYGYVHVRIQLGEVAVAEDRYKVMAQTLMQRPGGPNIVQKEMLERLRRQLEEKRKALKEGEVR